MDYNKILPYVKQMEALELYKRAEIELGAQADLIVLTFADVEGTPAEKDYRIKHEKLNTSLNHLEYAKMRIKNTGFKDLTVIDHFITDPFVCKSALEAIASGIHEFDIPRENIIY